jgi:hypothetical protein
MGQSVGDREEHNLELFQGFLECLDTRGATPITIHFRARKFMGDVPFR